MKRSSRKYSKGGVLMVYSTQNTDEGGAEEAVILPKAKKLSNDTAQSPTTTDDNNIKLSDLPDNYFDDLLDLDFSGDEDLEPENVVTASQPSDEYLPVREIQLIKSSADKSSDEDDEKLIVKIRQNVKELAAAERPKENRKAIKIILDKASNKLNEKVPDDVSLKRLRETSSPTDHQKIDNFQFKKAHISPIRAPASSPNPTTFKSAVHGTPQPIRSLLSSQKKQLPQNSLFGNTHSPPFEALSLPYFVQHPMNTYQNNYPQSFNFLSNHPHPNLLNTSPPNNLGWPVNQHLQQPPKDFAPTGTSNQIPSVTIRKPQPVKAMPSQVKKLPQTPNIVVVGKKAAATQKQSAVVANNSHCAKIKGPPKSISKSNEVPGKLVSAPKTIPSDANTVSQKKPTASKTFCAKSSQTAVATEFADKEVEVRPESTSFSAQCSFNCNKCNLYAKSFATVTELVTVNEPHPAVRARILKILCFLHATANGQTDAVHPYKNVQPNTKLVNKDKANASSKPNQSSETSQKVQLNGKGQSKNITAPQPLKPVCQTPEKIVPKKVSLSKPNSVVSSTTKNDCGIKEPVKNTPAKAAVTQVKNTPTSTVLTKSVPAKKNTNVISKPAQPSSVPPKVAAKKVQPTPAPKDNKKTSNTQPKPIKIAPPESSSKDTPPVVKIEPTKTAPNLKKENDVKVNLATDASKTAKEEVAQKKTEASNEEPPAAVLPSAGTQKAAPRRGSTFLLRGARAKTIGTLASRGRGAYLAPLRRGLRSRGLIPRGRSLRLRFSRANFNGVGHGDRGFAPHPHEPNHDYQEAGHPINADQHHGNSGYFGADDGDFSNGIGPNESISEYLGPQQEPWFEPEHENHGPNFNGNNEYFGPDGCNFSNDIGPNETISEYFGPQQQQEPWCEPVHENHGPNFEPMHDGEFHVQPNEEHFQPQFNEEGHHFNGPPNGHGPHPNFSPCERGRGRGFRGGRGFCPMGPEPLLGLGFRGRPSPRFGMMRSRGRPPRHWN